MKQNTLANSRETKYIKNTRKGNIIILIFSILLNNNARLFNFIGQSFLLNNTKIFDNSGELKYIKNTRKGNLMTFDKLLNLVRTARYFGQSFLLNNTKIFDNSGEPEYIKNTRKGNLMTFDKLLKNFKQDCPIFRTVFFVE